ncbi:MAG: MarR family transcriptional regulator [Chitinophagales bacterium]|nr:MarR family transcriptional regulator [Chitinophagales bacterium]HAE12654.1 hypothetical protein [Bacteroidota bacterium]MCB9022220.1 MarR family transcriptional regulator [Chitinophagales bacterium]HAE34589.1 hypothetical protein [Bacteroidota bacterium]HPE98015.1 MarR family transcriptional regulator [Chitinophagales bacterium]
MAGKKKTDPAALLLLMDQAVRHAKQQLVAALQRSGLELTADQWTLLRIVVESDGIAQHVLADQSGKDRPTVTRMLRLMADRGWVVQEPAPGDRRSFLILPTKAGQQVWKAGQAVVKEQLRQTFPKSTGTLQKSTRKLCRELLKK